MRCGACVLPDDARVAALLALAAFVVAVAPPLEARAKGFRWWPWAVPNLIGLLAVFLLPSARAPDLSDEERAARARHADLAGAAQSLLALAAAAVALARAVT